MLNRILLRYVRVIEQTVQAMENCHIEHYEEEVVSFDRLNLRSRIRFTNGYLLEINEAGLCENDQLEHLGYRYHFQDQDHRLVFRYDNTPHFPTIKSFPHHNHLPNQVKPCRRPTVVQVIREALRVMAVNE
jgi:hypothetical protein